MNLKYVFVNVVFFISIGNGQNRLKVELFLEKQQFLQGELIYCGVELTNNSSKELIVAAPLFQGKGLNIVLQDGHGKQLKYVGRLVSSIGQERITLGSNKSVLYVLEITYMFGKRVGLASLHKVLDRGEYVLTIAYESGLGDKLTSKAALEIIEPRGDEKIAYELFMETLIEGGKPKPNPMEFVSKLEELENKHPQSVYIPAALPILASWHRIDLKNEHEANETVSRFHQRYSLVSGKVEVINSFLTQTRDSLLRKQLILELQDQAKGKLSERVLKEAMKSLEP